MSGVISDLASYDLTEQSDALIERLMQAIREMRGGLESLDADGWPIGSACDALGDCLGALAITRQELQADLAEWRGARRGTPRPIGFTGHMGGAA